MATWKIAAIAFLATVFGEACRRTEAPKPEATAPSAARATVPDPVAELDRTGDSSPARLAGLCEAASGRLRAQQRQRCGEAHLAHAAALLADGKYPEARSALMFAETEGAPIEEVRALRRKIPKYEQMVGMHRPEADTAYERRRSAANALTTLFASSLVQGFDIKGDVGGNDCAVLLVTTYVEMEDSMIEALHRGDVLYGKILPGGVSGLAKRNGFRGVVYRDGYDTRWTYGEVDDREARSIQGCI